jgi:L-alanine-DL-glutamate epimerase-like enolase superfamily enzyme
MKITNIEVIPIYPRLAKRYDNRKVDLYGIDHRTVFKVETDAGITGYGDQRVRPGGQPDPAIASSLIGRNPFDFINNHLPYGSALNCALYDVMGKYLGVPVYKLIGQKVREAVSVAAWTRPASPETFRDEIRRAADEGYTIFKMHTCDYHDVMEQTRLAEEVAPEGFKIHYDFNSNRSLAAALPIIQELERNHPIVGYIEDPLVKNDIDGWRRLREQTRLPIIMHGTPLGSVQEIMHGVADIYMIGGSIGDTVATGFACGKANIQTILQFESGTLGKAMALHLAAVLPTHTAHSINLDDQYEEDYTTERIPVIEGSSPVPEGPGLGYEVDEDVLARIAANKPIEPPKHVGVLNMPAGHTFYGRSYVSPTRVTGCEEGTIRGIKSEIWEDDGSADFARIYERVQKEGTFRAN